MGNRFGGLAVDVGGNNPRPGAGELLAIDLANAFAAVTITVQPVRSKRWLVVIDSGQSYRLFAQDRHAPHQAALGCAEVGARVQRTAVVPH